LIADTSNSCDFYVDNYDTDVATVYKGINYDFDVENTTSEWPGDVCAVFVDWNRDFDYYDDGETIPVFGVPGRGPYNGTFSPPLDANLGKTRLRVRVTYGLENLVACGAVPYGEVEDYGLIVAEFLCADVDGDDDVDGGDIEYLKDYYFNGGADPDIGLIVGDANGDGDVNIGDLVYVADHVYRDGPAPVCLGL
ncbi:MAG: GEVED domain-containing protein, partial [Planctomycetota bacterium]|jgi:hypothetical protein